MTAAKLLAVGAVVETVTGIALIAVPEMVARLLFGAGIQPAGAAIGRVAGFALLALGFAWWPGAGRVHERAPLRALLAYNLLVAIFFFVPRDRRYAGREVTLVCGGVSLSDDGPARSSVAPVALRGRPAADGVSAV